MLEWSVRALTEREAVRDVVVVLPPAELDGPRAAAIRGWGGIREVVAGGATRSASVRLGLGAVGDTPFVLVHDAARPLAGEELVRRVIEATREHGAAIPALAVSDTVKRVGGTECVEATVEREPLRLAQTPQGARVDWLRLALDNAEAAGFDPTDEAAALEREGRRVAVVPGSERNRKITSAEDLEQARRLLEEAFDAAGPALRVGTGFDIHRVDPERPLVLGGVEFPGHAGLAGHSDADVVLHAAMDAVLGAAGLGDIGALFPPDDARFEGADSSSLARQVAGLIAEHGFEIVNLDITVLAERPKIRPRVEEMRAAIARALGLAPERIGLKATTLESLGALGRGEGVACQSVALIRRANAR